MSKPQVVAVIRAELIQRTLGTRTAAGFLRNRGFSLEEAVAVLAKHKIRA